MKIKRIIAFLLLASMLLLACACNTDDTDVTEGDPTDNAPTDNADDGKNEDGTDKPLLDTDIWLSDVNAPVRIVYGDGAKGAEVKVDKKSFTTNVYCIVKPRYVDETIVRHVAYMVFTSSTDASSALAELKKLDKVTLDAFLEVAEKNGAGACYELEDCVKGQLGSDEFDEWMYSDDRKKGDYTTDPIVISSSYIIGYFEKVGTLKAWEATVKNALLTEDLTAETARITDTYASTIEVKTNVMNRLGK